MFWQTGLYSPDFNIIKCMTILKAHYAISLVDTNIFYVTFRRLPQFKKNQKIR